METNERSRYSGLASDTSGEGTSQSRPDPPESFPPSSPMHRPDPEAVSAQSPDSLIDGSIRSNQIVSFDDEDMSSLGGTSWRIGMPWLNTSSSRTSPARTIFTNKSTAEDSRYYGGIMKSGGGSDKSQTGDGKAVSRKGRVRKGRRSRGSGDADSIDDFHESEWTPPDSAYGAACPVCGFIPKHVRRLIEFSMIAAMVLGFVYLLVTTSMHIANERESRLHNNSTTASDYHGGNLALDDDKYVEYTGNQDNTYDDDYYRDDHVNDDNAFYDDDGGDDDANNDNYQFRGLRRRPVRRLFF